MSPIFDALRRSEAERSGDEQVATLTATELLGRAERHMVGRLGDETDIGVVSEPAPTETNPQRYSPGQIRADEKSASRFSGAKATQAAKQSNLLDKVQTLEGAPVPSSRLVCLGDKESPVAEAFRLLGVRLRHIRDERRVRKILITSTVPQEGKSFSAGNLACTLAAGTERKTLLLEGDLRRPTLSQMFGSTGRPGLSEYVLDSGNLPDHIYRVEGPNLWLLPAGTKRCDPLDVIQSKALPALMDQLNTLFDWIIIDSPPILPLADTSAWAQLADGILLVTRRGVTEKKKMQRGLDAIDQHNLIGVLLNSSTGLPEKDYYYYRTESSKSDAAISLGD